MFKIKRMTVVSPEFKMAYVKLGQQPMKVATHMKYNQIGTRIEAHMAEAVKLQKELAEELTEKDADGKMVKEFNEDGVAIGYKWKDSEVANERFKEFSLAELTIDGVHPFFAYELEDAKLNNEEWTCLTEIIGDPTNVVAIS